jgi:hypothetical protein
MLAILALSVFFVIYVPAFHHPIIVDGMVADYFPSTFEIYAFLVSIVALPVSAVVLIVVFAVKVKQRFTSKRKAKS